MKYTREERQEIGRRIYEHELTCQQAAEEYGILPVVVNSQNMKCRFQLSDDVCHGVRIAEGTRQHDDDRSIFLSIGMNYHSAASSDSLSEFLSFQ